MGAKFKPAAESSFSEPAIFFVCHVLREHAYTAFLATADFKIDSTWLNKSIRNNDYKNIRNIVIDGHDVRLNFHALRQQLPNLRSLYILYHPRLITNFETLPDFAACKSLCCDARFKALLLNALFHRDDKHDGCWTSNFKGKENKDKLMANTKYEIILAMNIRTRTVSLQQSETIRYLVGHNLSNILRTPV